MEYKVRKVCRQTGFVWKNESTSRKKALKENLQKSIILPDIVIKLYCFHNVAVYKTRQLSTNQSFSTVSLKTPKVIHDILFWSGYILWVRKNNYKHERVCDIFLIYLLRESMMMKKRRIEPWKIKQCDW